MRTMIGILLVTSGVAASLGLAPDGATNAAAPLAAADLVGVWSGKASHEGETKQCALELQLADDGELAMWFSIPVIGMDRAALGRAPLDVQGHEIRVGAFRFTYDPAGPTLQGPLPDFLAPVYSLSVTLRRVESFAMPPPPEPGGEIVEPRWTFDVGTPLWAGPTAAGGTVYVGGDDGRLLAADAVLGREKWSFRAGGPIRTRPAVSGDGVFFQADDGMLYKLSADHGEERWRVRVAEQPIVRLPLDDPQSRYDPFGSDVVVDGERVYLGTHDGRVLAVDARNGARIWEHSVGGSVLGTPAVHSGRLYAGSFDGHVHAIDAATGSEVWKRDLRGAIVSTPAPAGSHVIVGTRSYDLFALDAATGTPAWKDYLWFSWIESSAVVRENVVYIGSSDAKVVRALDARSGEQLWRADVRGWTWGQPAVTEHRVYVGSSMMLSYNAHAQPGAYALDRSTGRVLWRYPVPAPESGVYGFPGSPAVDAELVFFAGLDGRLYAFAQ